MRPPLKPTASAPAELHTNPSFLVAYGQIPARSDRLLTNWGSGFTPSHSGQATGSIGPSWSRMGHQPDCNQAIRLSGTHREVINPFYIHITHMMKMRAPRAGP